MVVKVADMNKKKTLSSEVAPEPALCTFDSPITLKETRRYCDHVTQNHPDRERLLKQSDEMADLLLSLGMDKDTLSTALLFPLVQAEIISEGSLPPFLNKTVRSLIRGVHEMDAICQLKSTQKDNVSITQIDNVRRMLLAMVEDFRCVIVKLAERITYLRAIKDKPEDERILAAKECSNIFAPLANRLGIGQLKWELEDYCFRYLYPQEYQRIAKLLDERRIDRERYINAFVQKIREKLKSENVHAELYGRPKHLYSIWRKMQKKSLAFDELFDVRAVRIITSRLQDCYSVLGIIHTLWRYLPDEFDDYIANPKPNGYQSIHTIVMGPDGKTVEIQIRTREMHEVSELGVAAHWRYKENVSCTGHHSQKAQAQDERIAWLRKLLAWQEDVTDTGEILEEVRSQVFGDRVYVFTPNADVIDLPLGATPLDFAYHIHSDVGHRCIGAKVGGRIVPFTYRLKMGDQIEIITQKHPFPRRDWLNPNLGYVATSRTRAKILAWFRKQDRDKNKTAGAQILDNELSHLGLRQKEVEKLLLTRYSMKSSEELLIAIGSGDIRLNQMVNFLHSQCCQPDDKTADREVMAKLRRNSQNTSRKKHGHVLIEGLGNVAHRLAHCCQPLPGDDIIGFITQGRTVAIHHHQCRQIARQMITAPERRVEAIWDENYAGGYALTLCLICHDRTGLLRDITTVLASEKINVIDINSHSDLKKQGVVMKMNIEIYNWRALGFVLTKLNHIPGVINAWRQSQEKTELSKEKTHQIPLSVEEKSVEQKLFVEKRKLKPVCL